MTEEHTPDCNCDLATDNEMMEDDDNYEHITVLSPISQYISKKNHPKKEARGANKAVIDSLCLTSESSRAL